MMHRLTALLLATSTVALASHTMTGVEVLPSRAEATRKVYISASDGNGAAVTDLTASDIAVKEGGKSYPVATLQPATAPMHVAIIVDDAGTGGFQSGVAQFLQKTQGGGQFSMTLLNPQAIRILDFTSEFAPLKGALGRIGVRGRAQADGDQMLDAIFQSTKDLQQAKAERPVILAMTITGGKHESIEPQGVLTALRLSGAALNVVFVTGADLGMVLGDGPKQSGGRIEQAGTAPAIATALVKTADSLLHQYVLTYVLPEGVKMSERLTVSTSRKGVSLIAPSRISDK